MGLADHRPLGDFMSTMTPGQMRLILDSALQSKITRMFDSYSDEMAREIGNPKSAKTATDNFNTGMKATLIAWTIATEKHSPGV